MVLPTTIETTKWWGEKDGTKSSREQRKRALPSFPTLPATLKLVVTMSDTQKTTQTTFGRIKVGRAEFWSTCDKRKQNDKGNYAYCGANASIKLDREGELPQYRCKGCAKPTHLDMANLEG